MPNPTHHAVVAVAFYDRQKRILLQERKGISRMGEEWSFFGGHIEPGEHSEDAIAREIKEELGIAVEDFTFIGHLQTRDPDGTTIDRDIYIAPIEEKQHEMRLQEGSAMRMFTLSEARLLKTIPGDEEVLKVLERVL